MHICNSCLEFIHVPTHEIDGKPLCIYCGKATLILYSQVVKTKDSNDMLGIGFIDILDGELDGEFEIF